MVRCAAGLLAMLLAGSAIAETADDSERVEQGRRIYELGLLPSGKPLRAKNYGSLELEGAAVACTNCHRRSGMGGREANLLVPPITGPYLFDPEPRRLALLEPRSQRGFNSSHPAYTDETLARSLRDGIDANGREMNAGMPRYEIGDGDLVALTAYLRQLSAQTPPGVEPDVLHFATVITPQVAKEKREAVVSMLNAYFLDRNAYFRPDAYAMRMGAETLPRRWRTWDLSVWELQGDATTWRAQLEDRFRQQPVLALVSGVSEETWAPVHEFCEARRIPCLFPTVPNPPSAAEDIYSFYFSRGIALEAELLRAFFEEKPKERPARIIQIRRDDAVGRAAAAALTQALKGLMVPVVDRIFAGQDPNGLRETLRDVGSRDAVVFWLRQGDLPMLAGLKPPRAQALYFSTILSGGERNPWPDAWRKSLRLIYPYELPDKRFYQLYSLYSWIKTRKLPVVDERLQADTYYALLTLSEVIPQMLDNIYSDYMVERVENFVGMAGNKTIYPAMSSGPGQRFTAKGGYITRLQGNRVQALSTRLTP